MTRDFDLYFKNPKDLFVFNPQTYDPFDDKELGESGFDFIVARMIGFWFRAPQVRVRVYLPVSQVESDLQARIQAAMASWCDDLILANQRERREFLINNAIFLAIAILVLFLSWWLQYQILNPQTINDETLRNALVYALDILVWVALWTPMSAFLIEWFPLFRRYQAYRALQQMELSVDAQPS
jgi:hypothetical protein